MFNEDWYSQNQCIELSKLVEKVKIPYMGMVGEA